MTIWKETENGNAVNTAVAAAGNEIIVSGTQRSPHFNRLLVQNLDGNCDIELRLDSMTTGGRVFIVQRNGGTLGIEPGDGVFFNSIQAVNLSAGDAETAGAIRYRWARAVKIGD